MMLCKTAMRSSRVVAIFIACLLIAVPTTANAVDIPKLIAPIKKLGPEGSGHEAAIVAMNELSNSTASDIPEMLKGMNDANRLAENWLRSAIETAAAKGDLPFGKLFSFLEDKSNSQHTRRLAFELITEAKPDQRDAMLATMLEDPSLEIRRDAVALEISKIKKSENNEQKVKGYQRVLQSAREIEQIKLIAEALSELEVEVDLTKHFGLITEWQLIGPFENKNQAKFNEVYPPEKEIDLSATYGGMDGAKVKWQKHISEEDEGIVDLNKALSNHKGAITYAYAEFNSDDAKEVDVRLGCINANKVWINGDLVIENEVYHASSNLDQYISKTNLKPGKNTILIKVCQNEQKESWAQRWEFQFRISDDSGKAIDSK